MVAILVILTIVAFVLADAMVQRARARKAQALQSTSALPLKKAAAPGFVFENLSVPEGVFMGAGHTWLSIDPSGKTQVGMDDFVQRVIGRIDAVELPKVGEQVHKGDPLFKVRQGSRSAAFVAPIEGVVTAINSSLMERTDPLKTDPYQKGWVCALNPLNLAKDLRDLAIADDAKEWLRHEVQRFLAFIVAQPTEHMALGHVLQDGGQPADGLLEITDDETWSRFMQKFLRDQRLFKES